MQRVAKLSLLPVCILPQLKSAMLTANGPSDPATNEVLGNIPEMGLTETTTAIQAAAKAFVGWSKTTAKVCPIPQLCLSSFNSTKYP